MNDPVLVVANSDDVRFLLAQILSESGYSVLECSDSVDALSMAKKNPVSLVVLDLDMPKANGRELLRYFREKRTQPEIPIVAISSRYSLFGDCREEHLHIDECIEKPFSAEAILEAVGKHLPVYCLVTERPLRKGQDRRQAERRKA